MRRCVHAVLLWIGLSTAVVAAGPDLQTVGPDRLARLLDPAPADRALVFHAWATWCAPCIEEFPDIVRLMNAFDDRGVRFVLVSADFGRDRKKVEQFLARQGVTRRTYLYAGRDTGLIEALDDRWSGALPATYIVDRHGAVAYFHEGRSTYEKLKERIDIVLAEPRPNGTATADTHNATTRDRQQTGPGMTPGEHR